MSLRNALLVTLLDGEATGYELSKRFSIGAANFWNVRQAQLYAELARMESDGLVSSRLAVQGKRPNKRLFALTDAGIAEVRRYAAEPSERTSVKDELLVKVTGADICDLRVLTEDIERRRAGSVTQLGRYQASIEAMMRGRDEETFVRTTRRVGPYLTLLRGIAEEEASVAWCDRAAAVLAARRAQPDKPSRSRSA